MKFNFSLKGKRQEEGRYAAVKAWVSDEQWELYTALLSASLDSRSGTSYRQADEKPSLFRELIGNNDPVLVAKLAVYFREELHLRTLSFIVVAELAVLHGDKEWISRLMARILQQPAEIPEWMECYVQANNGKDTARPGRQVLKGIATVFSRLDEYQFTRYTREEQRKVKKALVLIRPKPKDKTQRVLFAGISKDRLAARTTWQMEWNELKQRNYDSPELQQAALRDKWKEGISSFRIGYAALLDQLPEILAAGVSGKVLKLAAEYLGNAIAVAGSGISPFRLLEIYRKLKAMDQGGVPMLLEALEQAARHGARSRTGFEEKDRVVVAMDVSDSMKRSVSEGSFTHRYDIGPFLALLLKARGLSTITGIIGNTWKPIDLPAQPVLAGLDQFHRREGEVGYAINTHLVIQDLLRKGTVVDKVMIFTDNRLWDNRVFHQPAGTDLSRIWKQYRQLAPGAQLCLFNLAGYGNKPLEVLKDGVFLISGWNDRILDMLGSVEKDRSIMEAIVDIEI
jgi:60 kDa SS-A/Ro ribonucleoprotein